MLKIEKYQRRMCCSWKNLRLKEGKVITEDDEKEEKIELHNGKATIKFIPLWKWVLHHGKKI